VTPKLDYRTAEKREPSWFWSGLWSEIRSEFEDVPLWLMAPLAALLLMLVAAFTSIVFAVMGGLV
jgi:hypothetical protein